MDLMTPWDPTLVGLQDDWHVGNFSYKTDKKKIPKRTNFFIVYYLDHKIASVVHRYKAYTTDRATAQFACGSIVQSKTAAYYIPTIEDFNQVMETCKEEGWWGALGVWQEEHHMSDQLWFHIGGDHRPKAKDAPPRHNIEDVTERPELANFWTGRFRPESWDDDGRYNSGEGYTTERELADKYFTMSKRAYRTTERFNFEQLLLEYDDFSYWYGEAHKIWVYTQGDDPEKLMIWTRSENLQLELKRDGLEDSYPPPLAFESEFNFSTYFELIARSRGYPAM